jgi:dihydrofolate reductase
MRQIFAFIMTTLDGYYEGPNQEFDFWVVDEEFNGFAVEQLDEVDTLLFGRVTYEGMAAYWPTPAGEEDDPRIAARMNGLSKIVVSRTLDEAEWANTRLIKDDVTDELIAQAAARQRHRDPRKLRSDGQPPADGAGRRSADHGEPGRARRWQVRVQDRT